MGAEDGGGAEVAQRLERRCVERRRTIPPIETLPPPVRSPARTIALLILRAYLLLAVLAVVIKVAGLIAVS